MVFYPQERVGLFIDGSNLYAAARALNFDIDYRMDMLVADKVVVELKIVDTLLPVHKARLLSYMTLSGIKLGLLINFNESVVKNGVKRIVNKL